MSYNYSSILGDDLSPNDPLFWSRFTPVSCDAVRSIGIVLCLAALGGVVLNGSLVYSFGRYRSLRTPPNIFLMFIATVGLLASCCILPLTGVSSIFCYWLFKKGGCQFEAVMAFLYGCSSSYLLCAVSLSRCYIIVRPFNAKDVTVSKCILVACLAVTIAFIWTILPLVGWNEYTLEGVRTSCCINWYDRRTSYISFTLFLFVFVYCVPLVILVTTNTIIYLGLKRMREKIAHGGKAELSQKKIEMERRILKSILITVCGFVCTWTPYAIVFFISAFRGKDAAVTPLATFVCACFAKSSVMWIPMLYISTSTHFKLTFVDRNAMDRQGPASSTAGVALPPAVLAVKKNDPTMETVEKPFSPIADDE